MESRNRMSPNLALAKALIRAGLTEAMILRAASISEYQFRQLQRELQPAH